MDQVVKKLVTHKVTKLAKLLQIWAHPCLYKWRMTHTPSPALLTSAVETMRPNDFDCEIQMICPLTFRD